jgi:hypothetical protein
VSHLSYKLYWGCTETTPTRSWLVEQRPSYCTSLIGGTTTKISQVCLTEETRILVGWTKTLLSCYGLQKATSFLVGWLEITTGTFLIGGNENKAPDWLNHVRTRVNLVFFYCRQTPSLVLSDGLTVDVLGAAGQAHSGPSHPLSELLSGAAGDNSEPWHMVSLPEFRFESPCCENL